MQTSGLICLIAAASIATLPAETRVDCYIDSRWNIICVCWIAAASIVTLQADSQVAILIAWWLFCYFDGSRFFIKSFIFILKFRHVLKANRVVHMLSLKYRGFNFSCAYLQPASRTVRIFPEYLTDTYLKYTHSPNGNIHIKSMQHDFFKFTQWKHFTYLNVTSGVLK